MPATPTTRKTLKLSVRATRLGISVRRVRNRVSGESYGYSWLVRIPSKVTGGARLRRQFKGNQSKEAVNFAEGAALKVKEQGQTAFGLTVEQFADAKQALAILQPLGMTLKDAAQFAAKRVRPEGGDATFGQLRDRIIKEKEGENLRPASLHGLRFYFGELVGHFGADTLVKTASYDQLRRWADSFAESGSSKRHVANLVGYAKQFFRYAADHKFVGENVAHHLKAPKSEDKAPAVLTIAEVKRLLRTAMLRKHRDLMPAVVIGLFCGGARTEELLRLGWEHVNLAERKITISPKVGKNRGKGDWRYPVIPPNAVEFLLMRPDRSGPLVPDDFRNRLTALHKAAGFPKWKQTHANARRHSFGSYGCKLHGADWCVDQMGNSVRVFLDHYRNAAVTKDDAQRYFDITPADVGQVAPTVAFPKPATKTA